MAACLIVATFLVTSGGCRHVYYILLDRGLDGISRISKLWFIMQPFVTMAIAAGRISVVLLILRIIGQTTTWRRYFLYFSIVSTFVINSLVSILLTVMCSPRRAFWTFEPAKCWDRKVGSDLSIVSSSILLLKYSFFVRTLIAGNRLERLHGYLTCLSPNHNHVESQDGCQEKDWDMLPYGLGCTV